MTTTQNQTKAFIDMAGPSGPRLVQLPGLDGLRGIAVAAVVLYHMGFEWMTGGYLGVSTFFTLSGFLITSILVNESIRDGRPSLTRFWSRRFRRLMPAALVALALIAVLFARTVATADQRLATRGDILSSLFYVANWRFILDGSTYGDLTSSPSPLLHFWSLSIEEQFYVFFPLVIWGMWKLVSGRRMRLGICLAAMSLFCSLLPWLFGMGTNRAYLGSDVRATEILLGGVLALVLSNRRVRRAMVIRYRQRTALLVTATVCAVVQVYWFVTVEQTSTWLYRGGLPLFAIMTCALIAAAALPIGPFRVVLGTSPLRWLGTRSYGIYLLHWPLLLAARQQFPEVSNLLRGIVAVGITLVLAEASFRLIESPVRLRRWPPRGRVVQVAASSFLVVAVLAALPLPVKREELATDFDSALDELKAQQADVRATSPRDSSTPAPSTSASSTTPKPTPPPVATVDTFGDSTALLMTLGLGRSEKDGGTSQLQYLGGVVELGCGVSRFDVVRLLDESPPMSKCLQWPATWSAAIEGTHPDVAILVTGSWEVTDAKLPGTSGWTSIGAPEADDFIRSELIAAADTLSSSGALTLMWLWPPYAPWADDQGRPAVANQHRSERMERLHQIMREVADMRPDSVRLLDLSEFLGPELLADRATRPDGMHVPAEKMAELFTSGLSQKIYDIFAEWWRSQNP